MLILLQVRAYAQIYTLEADGANFVISKTNRRRVKPLGLIKDFADKDRDADVHGTDGGSSFAVELWASTPTW